MQLRSHSNEPVVECIDNDETAAVITSIVCARVLVILTSVDGIDVYKRQVLHRLGA